MSQYLMKCFTFDVICDILDTVVYRGVYMITRQELDYIDYWASKTPYPGTNYALEALYKTKECLRIFNELFKDKNYTITFSDNSELFLDIESKNICHMLGVDYKNICSSYFDAYREEVLGLVNGSQITSYALISSLVDNLDNVLGYEERTGNRVLNFYKLAIKADIFLQLPCIEAMSFGCINIDRDVFQQTNNFLLGGNSTRYLYFPSDEVISPYYLLGLLKDTYSRDKYVVETLLAPINYKEYFNSQEVVIPTQILINDNSKLTKEANSSSVKLGLIKEYNNLTLGCGIDNKLNVYGDYISLLSNDKKDKEKQYYRR